MSIDKTTIRKKIIEKRDSLSKEEISKKSMAITESLLGTSEYSEAKNVLIYASMKNEVITDGIIEFDYSGYGHKMTLTHAEEDIESDSLTKDQISMVKEVIQRYCKESASDLELLTTAIYAYEHTGAKTRSNVAENVKKIKGTKYSDKEISWALDEFPYFGISI